MVDHRKPLRWPQLLRAARDPYRLQNIIEVRLEYVGQLQTIDAGWKRNLLLCLVWGKEAPKFGVLVKGLLYEDPFYFQKIGISSADTVLTDNRYLERGDPERGIEPFFSKPSSDAHSQSALPNNTKANDGASIASYF